MRHMRLLLALGAALMLTGCPPPGQVRQLSSAQIGYFDSAVQAINLQSEALIAAAETIKQEAEKRIAKEEKESQETLQRLVSKVIPSLPENQRDSVAKQTLEEAEKTSQTIFHARMKLANDLEAIKAKTQELQAYIGKMKEVQLTLDAYLQAEQVGEQLLKETLKQPTVRTLIDQINVLGPKVTEAAQTVKTLMGGLN